MTSELLQCSGCGRTVRPDRWHREWDACGDRVITQEARINKRADGEIVWQQQETEHCNGVLERRGPA